MPAPQTIFIDTGILDQECYDFSSARLAAFVASASAQNKRLLLPLPTKLEIEKHIQDQTRDAITALRKVREKNPLLRSIEGVPQSRAERDNMAENLLAHCMEQWQRFRDRLECEDIDCSMVSVPEVIGWYSQVQPPFSPQKRKEFPDAFALAALRDHAAASRRPIAVVSTDADFKAFCSAVSSLRFYPDLDQLTSEMVEDAVPERRFARAVVLAEHAIPALVSRILAVFPDRGFANEQAPGDEDDTVENVVATGCELTAEDIRVVAITSAGFEVSFRAEVTFTADVAYSDPDSWVNMGEGDIMYLHKCAGNVTDTVAVRGSAHVETDWEVVEEVFDVKIEDDYILIRERAPQVDDHEYDDDPS